MREKHQQQEIQPYRYQLVWINHPFFSYSFYIFMYNKGFLGPFFFRCKNATSTTTLAFQAIRQNIDLQAYLQRQTTLDQAQEQQQRVPPYSQAHCQ